MRVLKAISWVETIGCSLFENPRDQMVGECIRFEKDGQVKPFSYYPDRGILR